MRGLSKNGENQPGLRNIRRVAIERQCTVEERAKSPCTESAGGLHGYTPVDNSKLVALASLLGSQETYVQL